ncbi:UNVERIFIED_CONTAM: Pentatricopeptide repeat-containing protein, mitochondrial [Sesamum radiatum]|uniref:Pentatricopeptide repeat-containing protein, mitochondrial n=1 Tax=Sesamum radiatum TaxID=300843 RepID=A0AAW2TTK2_SESRA
MFSCKASFRRLRSSPATSTDVPTAKHRVDSLVPPLRKQQIWTSERERRITQCGLGLLEASGSEEYVFKTGSFSLNAFLTAISDCGGLVEAKNVFDEMPEKNLVTWNVLITGFIKWGQVEFARAVFDAMPEKNVISWTGLIDGYTRINRFHEALLLFQKMVVHEGIKPTEVTLLAIFPAIWNIGCLVLPNGSCIWRKNHGGLVDEGLEYYRKMVDEWGITPDIKHYGTLIDMLGRAGRLEEAERIALGIPSEIGNVVIWRTLLGACSFHGNVEMGERVTTNIMEMEREYGGDYVLLSNIFSAAGRFLDSERVRSIMDEQNAPKVPGITLV